jgi:hypothetical protein
VWFTRKERIGFAVVLAPAAVGVLLAFRPTPPDDVPEFDAIIWREHTDTRDGAHAEQARRLILHRTLLGKSRAEVVELLGRPTFCLRDGNEDPEGPDLVYQLGPYGVVGVDYEWLTVRLGPDGRVAAYFKWRD